MVEGIGNCLVVGIVDSCMGYVGIRSMESSKVVVGIGKDHDASFYFSFLSIYPHCHIAIFHHHHLCPS